MKATSSELFDPAIKIVSFSENAAVSIAGIIRPLIEDPLHPNPPRLEITALQTEVGTCDNGNPNAIVFVLERAGFAAARYVDMLRWCVARVIEREDFRLYVVCKDMTPRDQNIPTSAEGLEALEQLIDTVQITPTDGAKEICKQAVAYFALLEEIHKQAQWHQIRAVATRLIGWTSASVQVLCIAVAVVLVFWGLMWDGKVKLFLCFPLWHGVPSLGPYASLEPLVALVCGIAAAPFVLLLVYAYSRYGLMLQRQREDRFGVLYSGVASFGAPYILGLPIEMHAPIPWLALGLVTGVMLDAGRRHIYQLRREQRPVTPATVTQRHGRLPSSLRRQAGATWIHPLRCPLWPVRQARVFISYTRGSAWAHSVETALAAQLATIGARVFTDKGIRDGESWRRALNTELGRCTVFISLADPSSVERTWPAAEVEAALAGRDQTGVPELIVIRAPDLPAPSAETWRWLPVYREVLAFHENRRDSAPKVMDFGNATAQAVAFHLHPKTYRSVSVVPPTLAELFRMLWMIPGALISLCGMLGTVAGNTAFVVLALELSGKTHITRWLKSCGGLEAAFVASALWLGYTVRLALAARYHMRDARRTSIAVARRNGSIGLLLLLVDWFGQVDPLLLGWAAVIALFAYLEADRVCNLKAQQDQQFI